MIQSALVIDILPKLEPYLVQKASGSDNYSVDKHGIEVRPVNAYE
jgi:hypothetical protein